MTEKQIEKIKKKIRSYRAILAGEKRKFGCYDDSAGRRYEIPFFYMELRDFKGAMRYFNWFEKEFPDDIGDLLFNFIWAVTLFENKKFEKATKKLYKTAFSNTYLLDLLAGKEVKQIDKSELIWFERIENAKAIEDECKKIMSESFFDWLKEFVEMEEYKSNMKKFVSISQLLKDEEPGEKRNYLLRNQRIITAKLT